MPPTIPATSNPPQVKELEKRLKDTNDIVSRLENCYAMLADSTKNLEFQLT
jgi:hypothetical protein